MNNVNSVLCNDSLMSGFHLVGQLFSDDTFNGGGDLYQVILFSEKATPHFMIVAKYGWLWVVI